MLTHQLQEVIAPLRRSTNIIWFAFTAANLVYAVVAWLVAESPDPDRFGEAANASQLLYVLVVVAIASGIVLPWFIVPRFMTVEKLAEQAREQGQSAGPDPVRQPGYANLTEPDQLRARLAPAVQTQAIIRWAGAESLGVYGLLALFLDLVSVYGAWTFMAASTSLLLMLRPDYESALEKIQPGR